MGPTPGLFAPSGLDTLDPAPVACARRTSTKLQHEAETLRRGNVESRAVTPPFRAGTGAGRYRRDAGWHRQTRLGADQPRSAERNVRHRIRTGDCGDAGR